MVMPVYNAMVNYKPNRSNLREEIVDCRMKKYYTSTSFGGLLALAGRRLRLLPVHFEAVLDTLCNGSVIGSAPNRRGEQVSLRVYSKGKKEHCFHARET